MSDLINESSNKKRLGRGLGSLLGGTAKEDVLSEAPVALPPTTGFKQEPQRAPAATVQATVAPEARIWSVGIDKLQASVFQPRQNFEKEKLEELAQSIRQNGILQPIVARKNQNGKLEIIAGERRWRAAQLAGLHEVPVILKTLSNKETLELAIIENIQREDLNPIEEAEAYHKLGAEFHLTQQQIAEKVGKDRATVANSMRLLALPKDVRDLVVKGELSAGHAKVILSLDSAEQMSQMAAQAVANQMSVRKLEKAVNNIKEKKQEVAQTLAPRENLKMKLIDGLSEDLQKALGTKVGIEYKDGRGKITIQFYTDDGLTQIIERIKAGCQS
ncbi:MAG: chromosome partitioning protein ParB [Oligoflexia bacterium]|nr:MAG: chromosome partitioning protein ParB [Oligoflexia bacterium]